MNWCRATVDVYWQKNTACTQVLNKMFHRRFSGSSPAYIIYCYFLQNGAGPEDFIRGGEVILQ